MWRWLCLVLPLILLPLESSAVSAEEKGLAIVEEADRRDSGWEDQIADMVMILRNKQGQESKRHCFFELYTFS